MSTKITSMKRAFILITPPSYCRIKAVGYDMYLCKDNDEDGVIQNGRGERVG